MTPQQRYYKRNRKKVIARSLKWRRDNPDRAREIQRASDKRYAENRAAGRKNWRMRNPENVRRWARGTRKRHPEIKRAAEARRRARKYGSPCVCCSAAQLRAIYDRAVKMGKHVDHRKALSLGGAHCRKNLQLLTPKQHVRKSLKDYQKWLRR